MTTRNELRRGGGGRPDKGERLTFTVRVPIDVAADVAEQADLRGMTRQDYVEAILRQSTGRSVRLPPIPAQGALLTEVS